MLTVYQVTKVQELLNKHQDVAKVAGYTRLGYRVVKQIAYRVTHKHVWPDWYYTGQAQLNRALIQQVLDNPTMPKDSLALNLQYDMRMIEAIRLWQEGCDQETVLKHVNAPQVMINRWLNLLWVVKNGKAS